MLNILSMDTKKGGAISNPSTIKQTKQRARKKIPTFTPIFILYTSSTRYLSTIYKTLAVSHGLFYPHYLCGFVYLFVSND